MPTRLLIFGFFRARVCADTDSTRQSAARQQLVPAAGFAGGGVAGRAPGKAWPTDSAQRMHARTDACVHISSHTTGGAGRGAGRGG
jgi:hypothetical protein